MTGTPRPRRDTSNDVCESCESPHHATRNCPLEEVDPAEYGDY